MKRSFLGRLISYSPRLDRRPTEDFLTEVFAGLLQRDQDLLREFLRKAERKLGGPSPLLDGEPYEIETQAVLARDCRPDMVVRSRGMPRLICEHKLFAGFTGGEPTTGAGGEEQDAGLERATLSQVPRYARLVRERGWRARVLLLSRDRRPLPTLESELPGYWGNLLWSDVFDAAKKATAPANETARVLRQEFLLLMEEKGMSAPTPFRFGDSLHYQRYADLRGRMGLLLEQVVEDLGKRFVFTPEKGSRRGEWYDYRGVRCDTLVLDLAVAFSDEDEEHLPVWLLLHVRPDSPRAERAKSTLEMLGDSELGSAFVGSVKYPTTDEMSSFLGAWGWQEQVEAASKIFVSWFRQLAAAGLVQNR